MKHFTLRELTASDTAARLGIANTPDERQAAELIWFGTNVLDVIREAWGRPITVNNGFRTQVLNEAIGGSKTSQHMVLGEWAATDIEDYTRDPAKNATLYECIVKLQKAGKIPVDQCINEHNYSWIHISSRRTGKNRNQFFKLP